MSQAINALETEQEAEYVANTIKGFNVELPIMYDSELNGASGNTGRSDHLSKSQRTANGVAFCK